MTPFHSLDAIRAAEARQNGVMSAHYDERAALFELVQATKPFWPAMMSVEGYMAEDDRIDRLRPARRPRGPIRWVHWTRVPLAERLARYDAAVLMREQGRTFRDIGAHLGISVSRASQLVNGSSRGWRPEK